MNMSKEQKRIITLDSVEHRLAIRALYEYRNALLREGKPTEDVNRLTLRIIDAPCKKVICNEAR